MDAPSAAMLDFILDTENWLATHMPHTFQRITDPRIIHHSQVSHVSRH
jgi:hypothetical protein